MARQLLKDNGITVAVENSDSMKQLVATLPEFSFEEADDMRVPYND